MSGSPRTATELGEYVRNHRCHNADPNVTIADWDRGVAAIEAEAATPGESRTLVEALAAVVAALTSEDEIAHGEAVKTDSHGGYIRLGECAYDNEPWPCHTQRGIDRLLARIRPILDDVAKDPATPPESR